MMGKRIIKITVDDSNLDFMLNLLDKLNFVHDFEPSKTNVYKKEKKILQGITKPKSSPLISDFAGMWEHKPKNLKQLREKAWKRV